MMFGFPQDILDESLVLFVGYRRSLLAKWTGTVAEESTRVPRKEFPWPSSIKQFKQIIHSPV